MDIRKGDAISFCDRVLIKKSLLQQLIDEAERGSGRRPEADRPVLKHYYDGIRVLCGLPRRNYYLIDY